MEIKQLEYMTTAAEVGSFNKASELLYTTQSNVSKVIRGLEKEVGYSIFRRHGNGVILTDSGKILYDQALEIMRMVRNIDSFSEIANKTCFHIASIKSNFIASHFANFVNSHDDRGLCLKMWDGNMSYVLNLVEQREAELGFIYLSVRQYDLLLPLFQRKGLYFKTLIPGRLELCMGPKHPLYHRDSIALSDLKGLKYVKTADDNLSKTYHLPVIEQGLQLEEEMASAVEVGSSYALMNLLMTSERSELCYGIKYNIQRNSLKELRSVPIEYEYQEVALGYIHKDDVPVSELAQEFIARLMDSYDNLE